MAVLAHACTAHAAVGRIDSACSHWNVACKAPLLPCHTIPSALAWSMRQAGRSRRRAETEEGILLSAYVIQCQACSRRTQLAKLVAAPGGEGAAVDDSQHVALPAGHAVHAVRLEGAHTPRCQAQLQPLHAQLPRVIAAGRPELPVACATRMHASIGACIAGLAGHCMTAACLHSWHAWQV